MATISSIIKLHDGMSPALRSMNRALGIVLSSFESVQRMSGKAIDTTSIKTARAELAKANVYLDKVEQNINQNTNAQKRFNNAVSGGTGAMGNLVNQVKMLVGAYVGVQSIGGIVKTADALTNTSARLNMINDGKQTTIDLENKIYQAAMRSRGGYMETADAVAKLGLRAGGIFKSNDETIAFTETLNKMFAIAGASQAEMSSATLQLTQALGSGVLRGEEFNAVFEAAPNVMQAVAKYMNQPIGKLRELAKDGEISASIVKNALFAAAEDVNKQFKSMPTTWGQVWQLVKNYTIKATRPILKAISALTSNERFIRFMNGVGNAITRITAIVRNVWSVVSPVLGWIFDRVADIFNFIDRNWSFIAPIIFGIAAAFLVLKAPMMAVAIWTGICTTATKLWTAAQAVFNAVMAANPIGLVIIAIIALVALFYVAIAAVNKWCGTSLSATGLVAGYFMVFGANVYNVFATIWNYIAAFVNFFGNVFSNPIYSVKKLFVDLATNILNLIESITRGWDACATNLVNAMIDAVNGVLKGWNWLVEKLGAVGEKIGIGKATMLEHRTSITSDIGNLKGKLQTWLGDAPAGYKNYASTLEHKDVKTAWDTGYNWGSNFANKVGDFFSGNKQLGLLTGDDKNDIAKALSGALGDDPNLKSLAEGVDDINGKLDREESDLSFMRDLATQRAINRHYYTDMHVTQTNNNSINSAMDIDDVVSRFRSKLVESLNMQPEGVHY